MNLKMLSNSELLSVTQKLISHERAILTEILHHLLEIETRKLHLIEGYASMFQYAVQVLNYSEAQAYRRISAMRLLKEIPEIEQPLKDGHLNLTHLTQAKEYFKSEAKKRAPLSEAPLSKVEKLLILSSLENKTTRETEKIFATLNPDKIPEDRERVIRNDLTEIRFVASDALLEKLKQFKELDSHVQKDPNYAELFERLVDLALKQHRLSSLKLNPTDLKKSKPIKHSEPVQVVLQQKIKNASANDPTQPPKFSAPKKDNFSPSKKMRSRNISVPVKRAVVQRDDASCSFKNPLTGKRCGSTYRLQFDHVMPFAKKGDHSAENIRILCQNHNLFEAEKQFGTDKIHIDRH